MTNLEFTQGDATWKKLRHRAQTDLYWLNEVVLGYGPLIPMRPATHGIFCRFVERKTGEPALDEAPIRLILMPRETGKTTIGTQGGTVQAVLRNPNTSILIANEKEDNAKKFLLSIKREFESNEFLRALFPELIPEVTQGGSTRWSATEIDVKRTSRRKEPTVFVTGVGGTVTGMHPDEIVCDDLISLEAARNAKVGGRQLMEAVNDWLHTLPFLVNKNATPNGVTLIGTHWWHDDCYDHAQEFWGHGEEMTHYNLRMRLPDGTVQSLPAWRKGDIAVFVRSAIENGQSIFPEKWDLDRLAKMRVADPALFACNMLNQPSDEVTSTFKENWIRTYDQIDPVTVRWINGVGETKTQMINDLDRIVLVDPGGFATVHHGDRMRAAIVLTGSTETGEHLLLRCHSEQDTYLAAIQVIVNWARQYRPRKIVVEQTAQQAAFLELLRRDLKAAGLTVPVEPITPQSKAKDQRILDLEPFFQQGKMYIGRGPEFLEFRQQYSQFPRAQRVDLMDVLAYGPRVWRKPALGQGGKTGHEQRQAAERKAYLDRRAGTVTFRRT